MRTDINASSLIEAITASVVFMVVFIISLQTLGRVGTNKDISIDLIDADYRIYATFLAVRKGATSDAYRYDWGQITVIRKKYRDFNDLTELRIEATLAGNKRKIIRYFIIRNEPD